MLNLLYNVNHKMHMYNNIEHSITLLQNAKSLDGLRQEYRRLARVFHPDKGGDESLMQQLNSEYELRKKKLERKKIRNFDDLQEGDIVYVNGTECRVTHVSPYAFIAKARFKNKSAVFDKKTGIAVGNRRYRATFI